MTMTILAVLGGLAVLWVLFEGTRMVLRVFCPEFQQRLAYRFAVKKFVARNKPTSLRLIGKTIGVQHPRSSTGSNATLRLLNELGYHWQLSAKNRKLATISSVS